MKLLTEAIKKQLPPLGTTDGTPLDEKKIIVKFFSPWTQWTWYAVEGEYDEDLETWVFFGLVDGFEAEWGPFTLSELESVKGPFGLGIERDLYFEDKTIADIEGLRATVQ